MPLASIAADRALGEADSLMGIGSDSLLAAPLVQEMAIAWREGLRPLAESYLERHGWLRERPEAAIRLIYEEIRLRQELGARCDLSEVFARFPQWRAELQFLVECDELLDSVAQEPSFPEVTDELAGFRLLSELGRGAIGRVFLASQRELADRLVVLKVTPARGAEHRSLARVQHPHIVPLLSIHDDHTRGLRLLCLPYLGGVTLDGVLESLAGRRAAHRTGQHILEVIDRGEASAPAARSGERPARRFLARESYARSISWIGCKLAEALDHAHRRGLVHLDVKPSNILITSDGVPMLLDFHLARAPINSQAGPPEWLGGTPGFMAPEQRAAMEAIRAGGPVPGPVDARADVYALGAVLYRALAGQGPPASPTAARRRLRWLNSTVSRGLADILARCLDPDPCRRYADAAALADDLRRHLDDRPLLGVSNRSLTERLAKWQRRRPQALIRAAGTALAALGISAGALTIGASASRRLAEARAALLRGEQQLAAGHPRDAAQTLAHGLELLPPGALVDRWLLGADGLRHSITGQLTQARRADLIDQLHSLVRQLRLQSAPGGLAPAAGPGLEGRLAEIWSERDKLLGALPAGIPAQTRARVLDDLSDVAILWADLHVRLAEGSDRTRAMVEALRFLDEAEATCGPASVFQLARRALAEKLGRTDLVRTASSRLAGSPPRTPRDWTAMGRFLLRSGQLQAASRPLDRAVELDPGDFSAHFDRGCCALGLRQYPKALEAFAVCVTLNPGESACYYNRGLAYSHLGEKARARHDFERARQLNPAVQSATPAELD